MSWIRLWDTVVLGRKTARRMVWLRRQLLISEAQHHEWLCDVELTRDQLADLTGRQTPG